MNLNTPSNRLADNYVKENLSKDLGPYPVEKRFRWFFRSSDVYGSSGFIRIVLNHFNHVALTTTLDISRYLTCIRYRAQINSKRE